MKSLIRRIARRFGYAIVRWRGESLLGGQKARVDPRVVALVHAMRPVTTDLPLIRAGGREDGAYLLPDDLDGIEALFSPGVDQVALFEEDMAARGMRCYLADASVDGPPVENDRFHFEQKFLGLVDDGSVITLANWVERHAPGDGDLMLQIDIEGAEWLVLAAAPDALLARFRIIVAEFHALSQMFEPLGAQIMPDVLTRLLRTHHVVHVHPNNVLPAFEVDGIAVPDVIEVTFLRQDRARATGHATQFPHPLDIVNVPHRPALPLPDCWRGSQAFEKG